MLFKKHTLILASIIILLLAFYWQIFIALVVKTESSPVPCEEISTHYYKDSLDETLVDRTILHDSLIECLGIVDVFIEEPSDDFVCYNCYVKNEKHYKICLSENWQRYIYEKCEEYSLSYSLVIALMGVESGFNPYIGYKVGKNGVTYYGAGMINVKYNQEKLKRYGVNLCTPEGGIEAICILLRQKLDIFDEDEHAALMAYNGGNAYASNNLKKGITTSGYSRWVFEIRNNLY